MNILQQEPAQSAQSLARRRTTVDLSNPELSLTPHQFFEQAFPDVLEKGRIAAATMAQILEGHRVRRTYFLGTLEAPDRPSVVFQVAKISMEEAGLVRVYDVKGTIREFPALMFNFVYRDDAKAVSCICQEYTVVLERVD